MMMIAFYTRQRSWLQNVLSMLAVVFLPLPLMADPIDEALARWSKDDFAKLLPWVGEMYDPESGGFHISQLAKSTGLAPDIQSTAQALQILDQAGVAKRPPAFDQKLIGFFQSRQRPPGDPYAGFFIDPAYAKEMIREERVLGRSLAFSTASLEKLGAAPLYPLPGSAGTTGVSLPPQVRSEQAWEDWLKKTLGKMPGYQAMDALSSQKSVLQSVSDPAYRARLTDLACDYAAQRQDSQTGMWVAPGDAALDHEGHRLAVDGTFKGVRFFTSLGRKVPLADRMQAGTLLWISRTDAMTDTPRFGNAARLLRDISSDVPALKEPDLLALVRWHDRLSDVFVAPDGGLRRSTLPAYSIRPNDVSPPLGKGIDAHGIGDMNGTANLMAARQAVHELAGRNPMPLPGAEEFLRTIARKAGP